MLELLTGAARLVCRPRMLFLFALLVGSFIRLYGLGSPELDYDESCSVSASHGSVSEIVANVRNGSAPPAMFVLTGAIVRVVDSTWAARILPSLAGILTIVAVYMIALEFFPEALAGLAALLCALSVHSATLSREYRVYTLGGLGAALGILALVRFRRKPDLRRALVVGAVFLAGLQLQYATAIIFGCLIATLPVLRYDATLSKARLLGYMAVVGAFYAAGVLLVYETALKTQYYPGRGSTYLAGALASPGGLLSGIRFAGEGAVRALWYAYPNVVFIGLMLVAAAWLARRDFRSPLFLAFAVPMAAFALLGIRHSYPFGAARQCLPFLVAAFPLAPAGLYPWWKRRHIQLVVATIAALLAGPELIRWEKKLAHDYRPDLRSTMAMIDGEFQAGDAVLVTPGTYPQWQYYARNFRRPWIKAAGSEAWMGDERAWRDLALKPPYVPQVDELLRAQKRVWLVSARRHPGEPPFSKIAEERGWTERSTMRIKNGELEVFLLW